MTKVENHLPQILLFIITFKKQILKDLKTVASILAIPSSPKVVGRVMLVKFNMST